MRMFKENVSSLLVVAALCLGLACAGVEIPSPSGGAGDITVNHRGYTVSYDYETQEPAWVAWQLTPQMRAIDRPRPDVSFRVDSGCASPDPANYAHSGHDLGHLCPSDDLESDTEAMRDTFYTSNACPQSPTFNRGIWKELETETRDASRQTELWVYRGPAHAPGEATIGKDHVPVPVAFWAVAFAPSTGTAECYIIPHATKPGGDLAPWRVDLSTVEKVTGLDFVPVTGGAK